MARSKREKKEEAKRIIDDVVPTLPIPRFAPAPVRGLNLILKGAETLAQGLVEVDPLGIITEPSNSSAPGAPDSMMMAMVNDPSFKLTKDQVDLINNDDRMLMSDGNGVVEVKARDVVRQSRVAPVSRSFAQAYARRVDLPNKRTRKKTKTDKNMSKALEEANRRLRTQKGKLRKGKTQADIMRLAHRLRKRM